MRARSVHVAGRWVGALVALVALVVAGALGGCEGSMVPEAKIRRAPPPVRLVVVTPHSAVIREVFERGFSQWHAREFGTTVDIHWIARGTPQCVAYAQEAASGSEMASRQLAPDLMFGGGLTEHRLLADRGLARALDEPLLLELATPKELLGVPLVDDNRYWHATALSDFGILYHKQMIARRALPEPRTWADLADPAYFGWVAVADPTISGSNRFCLGLMLQRYGWEQGWGLILRLAANARVLLPGSSDVIRDVASGMCLAGLSVNFSALREIAIHGEDRLGFVAPRDATAITPDLTTILNYAAVPEVAERFLRYCLSEEGQAAWGMRGGLAGAEDELYQGAVERTLFRYPARPAVYKTFASRLAVKDDPFERQTQFRFDVDLEAKQAKIVAPLLVAACGENHILLQRAWRALIDAGMPQQALAEMTAPPFDEQTAYELGARYEQSDEQAAALAADWAARFRAKYEKALASVGK